MSSSSSVSSSSSRNDSISVTSCESVLLDGTFGPRSTDKSDLDRRNANASLKCPIEAGEHAIVQSVDLPKEIPKGQLQVACPNWR